MKLKIETDKFRSLLDRTMVADGSETTMKAILAEPYEDGVLFRDKNVGSLQIWHLYKKPYFKEVSADGTEPLIFSSELYSKLKVPFKNAKDLDIYVADSSVCIRGGEAGQEERLKVDLIDYSPVEFKAKIENQDDYGLAVKFTQAKPSVIVKISTSVFDSIPRQDVKNPVFEIRATDKSLTLAVEDTSGYERDLKLTATKLLSPIKVGIDHTMFNAVLKGFQGDFWLFIHSDFIVMSQDLDDRAIITLMATNVEKKK